MIGEQEEKWAVTVGAIVTIQNGQVTQIEGGAIYGTRFDERGFTVLDLSALLGSKD